MTIFAVTRPKPFQSKHSSLHHHGQIALVADLATIDLGMRHNNFDVQLTQVGGNPIGSPRKSLEWAYGSVAGTFDIRSHAQPSQDVAAQVAVRVATVAALPAVTQAGAGLGATLTADAVGILTVDGVAIVLNDIILVKDQAAGADNGIYAMTTEGTGGVAFILTRQTTHDTDAEVVYGDWTTATAGATKAGKGFVITTADPITVDTTAVTWSEFEEAVTVSFQAIESDAAS